MRRITALLLCLLMMLGLCACQDQPQEPETSGGILSAFTAEDLQGNAVDQTVLQGHKLTMVNVWATYCSPCIAEMPDLGALSEKYATRGVQMIGLVSDVQDASGSISPTQVALAEDIIAQTGANYLHIVPTDGLNYLMYQISAVPTTFFVDETGKQIGGTYVGAKSLDEWAEIIGTLLEEVQ